MRSSGRTTRRKGSETVTAAWKIQGFYKADPEKVASELEALGAEYTLSDVVEKAKDSQSEMHGCFEWNDTIAGQKYRESQAASMIRQLVIVKDSDGEPKKTNIRFFVSTGKRDNTYTPTKRIIRKQDEYEALLERAMAELRAFKQKYSSLSELDEILSLID